MNLLKVSAIVWALVFLYVAVTAFCVIESIKTLRLIQQIELDMQRARFRRAVFALAEVRASIKFEGLDRVSQCLNHASSDLATAAKFALDLRTL